MTILLLALLASSPDCAKIPPHMRRSQGCADYQIAKEAKDAAEMPPPVIGPEPKRPHELKPAKTKAGEARRRACMNSVMLTTIEQRRECIFGKDGHLAEKD